MPALLPLVGPGAITPMEKVPAVARNEAGIVACISLPFTKLELGRFVALLPLLFQVTLDPETKPEPLTVKAMSFVCPATAPLGLIELIEELIVGEAPR